VADLTQSHYVILVLSFGRYVLVAVLVFCREAMATDSDGEFLDARQNNVSDAGDAQLLQLQEQLVATMIENENISWSSHC